MVNNTKINIISIAILIAISFIGIYLRLLPYVHYKYDFLIGFDTGKYINELQNGISTNPKSIDLWVEPGLNTLLSGVRSIAGGSPKIYYEYIIPIFVSTLFIFIIYKYSLNITKSKISSFLSAVYISTSIIFLQATFGAFYRQIFASVIFLIYLYFVTKILKDNRGKVFSSLVYCTGILGAGIIFYHRAITFLFALSLVTILVSTKLFTNNYKIVLKKIIAILLISIFLSAPYWMLIVPQNLQIIMDTIISSIHKSAVGASVVNNLNREENQIILYFQTIPLIVIAIIGLIKCLISKSKSSPLILVTLVLIPYIFIRGVFSNRYILDIDIIFSIFIGRCFSHIEKYISKYILLLISTCFILINIFAAVNISLTEKPYILYLTASIEWVENNINKKDAIIVAPDALSTIFTSLGYKTAIYEFPLKTGHSDDRILKTENLLLYGQNSSSVWKNLFPNFKKTYVIFGQYDIIHPLGRLGKPIDINSWDVSQNVDVLYKGDYFITRIYQININAIRK